VGPFFVAHGARDRRESARHNKKKSRALELFALVSIRCHSEEHSDEESAFSLRL
jgi:hypothetical protein